MTAFEEFGVLPEIAKAVEEMEWTLPTDVQAEAIPLILGGGDVLMAAETGSGKTGAFCLPILQIVWETLRDVDKQSSSGTSSVTAPAWTMSYYDRDSSFAVSPDGLRCQAREFKEWHGARCTRGVQRNGKWYFEATVTDEGLCRVGFSTMQAKRDLGTCRFGYGFGGTGKKSNNKQFDNYGEAFGKCDVIGCCLDLDAAEVKFLKNGVDLGVAFKLGAHVKCDALYPAVVLKNAEMLFNFGATPLKYLPSGYQAISAAPPDVCVINPSSSTSSTSNTSRNAAFKLPKAIILEPSRELCEQTFNQIQKFKKYLPEPNVKEVLLIGGISVREQMAVLNAGVDIVCATPGRLEDLIQGGYLSLTQVRFLVLDEADGLLKSGYNDLINRVYAQIPKMIDARRLQMVVCSATLHNFDVKKMAERLMHFPAWIDLKGEDSVPETVHHVVCMIDPRNDTQWRALSRSIDTDAVHARDTLNANDLNAETLSEAVKLLKGEYVVRAIAQHRMDRALLFCRTKLDCDNLERYLNRVSNAYTCVCLHGDRKPHERKSNLDAFKRGAVKFLICTDVAARGIDITGVPYVINVTLPDDKANYVHRIGRVGRADRMGLAISLVAAVPEKVWYHGEWCSSRGRNCVNTRLTTDKPRGCCVWYNERALLAEIEEHLNMTIAQVDGSLVVPVNEFDGKVVYGGVRRNQGTGYADHVAQIAPTVAQLAELESNAQMIYLRTFLQAR